MDDDSISDIIILALVFIGTISFAITSFGGDILFQLGISLCSLSGTLCRGSLLTTLAMITLMAFIKLPIQLCILRKNINYDLAIRLSIPMVIGSVLGLHILSVSNNDLLLKRIFGYIITIISLYHLVNDSIKDSRSNIVENNNEEVHNDISSSSSDEVNPHLYISYTMKNDQDNYRNDTDNKFKINTRSKELTIYCAGFLAGLLAGVYGTGGPPLMVLATHIKIDKDEWRATCTLTYFIQNLVAATYISTYDQYRIKSGKQYMMTMLLICTVLIALYYGNIIADQYINTNLWKKLILFLLMIGSGIMICSGYSVYIQFITILVLMSLYGGVYCMTLKYLGVEIISTIRNQYYNVPIEESIPHREGSDLNHITIT